MKLVCTKCSKEKEDTEFHNRKNRPKGRASTCKTCSNERWRNFRDANPEKIAQNVKNWLARPGNRDRLKVLWARRDKSREQRLREILDEIKKDKPCKDCGVVYPSYALDFDHRPGEQKLFNVSRLSKAGSVARLLEEIAKCDLVCAVCHRIRTHIRKEANKPKEPR